MKLRSLTTILSLTTLMLSGLAMAQKQPAATGTKQPAAKTSTTHTAKKLPARDPKTGRFVKSSTATMAKTKTHHSTSKKTTVAKKTPARDPKTGRFVSTKKS